MAPSSSGGARCLWDLARVCVTALTVGGRTRHEELLLLSKAFSDYFSFIYLFTGIVF